jgi:hypothetical protein
MELNGDRLVGRVLENVLDKIPGMVVMEMLQRKRRRSANGHACFVSLQASCEKSQIV